MLCELCDSLGLCPTNVPKGGLEKFEVGGSSICQNFSSIFWIHGLMETSLFACGMSTLWTHPALTTTPHTNNHA